jgi:2-polyprenyl-3-methyl-5-hydroxy-6-metoxy-1,4-benzoquinol methylase
MSHENNNVKDEYISVKCDLCGKDDPVLMFKKHDFSIVRCSNCRLVYVNPRLVERKLSELYNENVISPLHYYLENRADDEKTFEKRLDIIEGYVKKGRLLDVGCAIGTFSNVARRRGWEVTGIDINEGSARYCKEKLGLDVVAGSFDDMDFPHDSFDVVLMNDLLEHVPSPTETLEKARSLIKKGGFIFIVTPKIDSFMARVSRSRWLHLKPNEHLFYFSKDTIKKLLEKTGFSVVEIKPMGRHRNLKTVFSKAATYGNFVSKISKPFVNSKFAKNKSIHLNLRDEMAVIARKA